MDKVVILPYRKKTNHKEYLINLETIEKWDQHPDHCSISFEFDHNEEIDVFLKNKMDALLNVETKKNNFINLGICTESKKSSATYYLYCINISNLKYTFNNNQYQFIKKKNLIENIDSQLIVAYTRMTFLNVN